MDYDEYAYGGRKPFKKDTPVNSPDDSSRSSPQPVKPTSMQEYLKSFSKVSPSQNSGWNMTEGVEALATGTDPDKIGKPSNFHTQRLHSRLLKDKDKGDEGKQDYCWRRD